MQAFPCRIPPTHPLPQSHMNSVPFDIGLRESTVVSTLSTSRDLFPVRSFVCMCPFISESGFSCDVPIHSDGADMLILTAHTACWWREEAGCMSGLPGVQHSVSLMSDVF